jgi:RNA polymerase sigma factor (sigma-70 family)
VASWPTIDRLDDQRLAISLGEGDADALTQIYDTYAPGLYEYCHALLRDEMTAAYALHDSLIAATEHVGRLREPERLRAWLYALVRAECVRLRDDPERPASGHEAPEIDDSFLDDTERTQREETRQLVHSALSGLTGRQREALDLTVRHELTTEELASVLSVSTRQSAELARQARSHLGKTVAAALTARTLKDDCPSLAALTDTWPLSADACSRLVRHIENCPTCSEHRPREVSINRLLQVLPIAAAPEDLRTQVLTTATAAEHSEDRLALAERAMPLDASGWPVPAEAARAPQRTSKTPVRAWPIIAAAAAVVLIVGAVMWLAPSGSKGEQKESSSAPGAVPSEPGDSPSNVAPVESGLPPTPSPSTSSKSPTPTHTPSAHSTTTRASSRPTTKAPAPPPKPGTLSLSGCRIPSNRRSCTITLTAQGGSVNWRVTGTSDRAFSASGSGTLAAGQSTGVTVTVSRGGICFGGGSGSVSFSPGGSASVSYSC